MKRVLVTGGGTGIGREISRHFAVQGNSVTICGRRPEVLEQTARDFKANGHRVSTQLADVTVESEVRALFDQPFDIVIANAGVGYAARLENTTLDMWNETMNITLTGVFLTFREALANMPAGGRLIAIASIASLKGTANTAAYSAAKHGVLGLVRSTALEVATRGITCNAVCPGFVDTPMADTAVKNVMSRFQLKRDEAVRKLVAGNPLGRMITVDEVAAAVDYLTSDKAAMINGHAMTLSGGEQ